MNFWLWDICISNWCQICPTTFRLPCKVNSCRNSAKLLVGPLPPPNIAQYLGELHEPCARHAHIVHLLGYYLSARFIMPESELRWLVPGLAVYYHRSTGSGASHCCWPLSKRWAVHLYSV